MLKAKTQLMSTLLREIEADIGTRDMANTVFQSLIEAIQDLKAKNASEFCAQFQDMLDVISNTEPKFGLLNCHFATLFYDFEQNICSRRYSEARWKKIAIKRIKTILSSCNSQKNDLLKNAEKIKVDNKIILLHDNSHTVQDVLVHLHNMGKKFRVIIAEQDFEKTQSNIERLHSARIPFQVVPAYMLSHIYDEIDMLFFGAVTLKDNMDFVMSPGSHGLVSELHVENIPAYVFLDTSKFSLWKSQKKTGVFIHRATRCHRTRPISYERIKYSHDRVQASLFDKIITNEGTFSSKDIEKIFKKHLRAHKRKLKHDNKTKKTS